MLLGIVHEGLLRLADKTKAGPTEKGTGPVGPVGPTEGGQHEGRHGGRHVVTSDNGYEGEEQVLPAKGEHRRNLSAMMVF